MFLFQFIYNLLHLFLLKEKKIFFNLFDKIQLSEILSLLS